MLNLREIVEEDSLCSTGIVAFLVSSEAVGSTTLVIEHPINHKGISSGLVAVFRTSILRGALLADAQYLGCSLRSNSQAWTCWIF